ncbi:MAG: helix-turn-helix transcriptional regulator [Lawsonibacter sp.]|nr:helix-turn-helix transcriptional regulator [Lawsonibacter sp.]
MTLAEKILSLRTERGMSQDDLAEKLEVSRQSVSKWETAQSTPDLDKIIKLADLFGVSVDQLVRDGERPQPPEPSPPQTVYVERRQELSPLQKLGVVMEASGAALAVIGLMGVPLLIWAAAALVILGLPLLLSRKHPLLIDGWLVLAVSWYLCPLMGMCPSKLWSGVEWIYYYFAMPGPGRGSILLGGVIVVAQRVLLIVLAVFTGRAWGKAWKEKRFPEKK